MKVTAVTKQQRGERYNIFADGEFVAGVEAGTLTASGLGVGDEVTAVILEDLKSDELYRRVLAKGYDYLSRRMHSRGELQTKLATKFDDQSLIDRVLDYLTEKRYLDDEIFATQWVANRGISRGPHLLRQELRRKLISSEIIDRVLAEQGNDRVAAARTLAEKKLAQSGEPINEVYQKVAGHLQRRGYSYHDIRAALDSLKQKEVI